MAVRLVCVMCLQWTAEANRNQNMRQIQIHKLSLLWRHNTETSLAHAML